MSGTGIAYPIDASSGTPQFAAAQGRTAFAAAMAGATSSRPLGGLTGVRPGTPTNTVTATSTTWTVQPFGGYIDLHTLATNGGYLFSFQSVSSGTMTAAGGSARTDIVWVRIDDSNTGDSSGARQVVVDYTANTTTPPARAFVIAQINVPASGGGSPTVTWVAPYTTAAGGITPVSTAPATSYKGQYVDDGDGLLRSDGTAFHRVAPFAVATGTIASSTGSNAITLPSGRFSVAPIIFGWIRSPSVGEVASGSASSSTAATINTANGSGFTTGKTVDWLAIQMLSATAAG